MGKKVTRPSFAFGALRGPRPTYGATKKHLTAENKKALLAIIPARYQALNTADTSGKTDAERLIEALDAGIVEYTSRGKQAISNEQMREHVLGIAKAAEKMQKAIQIADPMARDMLDAGLYAYSMIGGPERMSQATRYAINWKIAMEADGLAAEASGIESTHPNYRADNHSLLQHLWDMLSDVQAVATRYGKDEPPDKNNRLDRRNASLFAWDCVRHCTWSLNRRLPKAEWVVELVGMAAEFLQIGRVGREAVFWAIEEWDPENKAFRLLCKDDRAP